MGGFTKACGVAIDFLEPHDVAAMLALLKIARIASGHAKADNWVDLAGYAACGGEIQSAADNPAAPIITEDKPVEPWGDEDERRQDNLLCDVGKCYEGCVFKEKANAYELESCEYWCQAHPAEARKIMDEMEGNEVKPIEVAFQPLKRTRCPTLPPTDLLDICLSRA